MRLLTQLLENSIDLQAGEANELINLGCFFAFNNRFLENSDSSEVQESYQEVRNKLTGLCEMHDRYLSEEEENYFEIAIGKFEPRYEENLALYDALVLDMKVQNLKMKRASRIIRAQVSVLRRFS